VDSVNDTELPLERGDVPMALVIPPGYGELVASARGAEVQILADGSDASFTSAALGYTSTLIGTYARELAAGDRRTDASAGIEPRIRVWFNPQLESRFFIVPGVLALLLLVVTANLSSMAIVRERELGTLEQLSVTPLRRWELIVGKLLPYALIGMLDALLVLMVAIFWFEVPLLGSIPLLLGFTLLYLMCTLGLGLFVSTISHTQQQAMMTTVFFFLMPMVYLSGFVFPIENMPAVVQPFTYLIPLRYYLVVVRGIFLKGVGMETLWPQAAGLLLWSSIVLALAVVRLNKRSA
jgi:ABC-2 type transport system permease protein